MVPVEPALVVKRMGCDGVVPEQFSCSALTPPSITAQPQKKMAIPSHMRPRKIAYLSAIPIGRRSSNKQQGSSSSCKR